MKKCHGLGIDLAVQSLIILLFLGIGYSRVLPIYQTLLGGVLLLGVWQLVSTVVWGLVCAEYSRGQYFMVAVMGLVLISVLLSLPEFRDSELIIAIAKFGALVWVGSYYLKSFWDFKKNALFRTYS